MKIGYLNFSPGNYIYHNWIDDQGDFRSIIQVFGVTKNYLAVNSNRLPDYESITFDEVKPIPLSEEWLILFGFIPEPWGFVKDGFLVKFTRHFNYNRLDDFWIEIGNGKKIKLPFVHTLQNFFALTGKELII